MEKLLIKEYEFNENGKRLVSLEKLGRDWPVVYLINNESDLYVGETQNITNRFEQHLKNSERKKLKEIRVVFDNQFNKSATLDIEQSLIQLFAADNKYKLQNLNGGQSAKHNYYQRETYVNKVEKIWNIIYSNGMANSRIEDIKNSDLFKYSPYNTLTEEQNEICRSIIYDIVDKLSNNKKGVSIISGTVGTGKTIVLINMIYKIINANKFEIDLTDENSLTENNQLIHDLQMFNKNYGKIKIGYVVPMTSIRKTIKTVFYKTKNGLEGKMVISPYDVFKDDYDVVFVDETHRLAQYKNISNRGSFKSCAKELGYDNPQDTNQLDMIIKKSKYCVLVYDKTQSVKGSDITHEQFEKALLDIDRNLYMLTSQMRCSSGEYVDYVTNILNCTQSKKLETIDYDFKIFDIADEMINLIKKKDKEFGLCRNAAGYSWKWKSKGIKSYNEVIKKGLEDISIQGKKYVWNMTNSEFILSDNAINEIGCIHTLQGYDLNYVGVIFGEEIDYDGSKMVINEKKFYDKYVKNGTSYEELKKYIINSYKVIMTRGIKGCYVYACNENLRKYLEKFIDKYEENNG